MWDKWARDGKGKGNGANGFGADKSIVGVGDRCRARFVWFGVSCGMMSEEQKNGEETGPGHECKEILLSSTGDCA